MFLKLARIMLLWMILMPAWGGYAAATRGSLHFANAGIYYEPKFTDPQVQASLGAAYQVPALESFQAAFVKSFWNQTLIGNFWNFIPFETSVRPVTEAQYKASPYYRSGLHYTPGMTVDDAANLARLYDERKNREFILAHSAYPSLVEFFGAMVAELVDPLTYLGAPEWRFAKFLPAVVRGGSGALVGKIIGLPFAYYSHIATQEHGSFSPGYLVSAVAAMLDGAIVGWIFSLVRQRKRRRADAGATGGVPLRENFRQTLDAPPRAESRRTYPKMLWRSRNIFDRWAMNTQRKELSAFVDNLRAMDSQELGALLAIATDARHSLEAKGHMILDPIVYFSMNPGFLMYLSHWIIQLQKEGKPMAAAALAIWLHTMRAGARLELRQLGRDMWRELTRGFPSVAESAADLESLLGRHFNTEDASVYPKGLTPEPT